MNLPENVHALRYATEATKLFLMDEYKKHYPQYFQDATLVSRPATNADYYVPPSIASNCIVVTATRFSREGCKRFACFPFKENLEPCSEKDPLQWIHMGQDFQMACQPSCRDHSIDADWTLEGRCVVSNASKKALAIMPEQLFENKHRHAFHGGLDVVDGRLRINRRYCEAYGLDFTKDNDCVSTTGQHFGEWLFGKTVIRAAKAAKIKPFRKTPPPIPNYMVYRRRQKSRQKRSYLVEEPSAEPIYTELAVDIAKDLGTDVTSWAIENFLKRKAPKLLGKAIGSIPIKLVLRETIVKTMTRFSTLALRAAGTSVGIVTSVYAIYSLVVGILDATDAFGYQKVLKREKLDELDRWLDDQFFLDGKVRPELTPEYVWDYDILDVGDESMRYNFMATKVQEYLDALHATKPKEEVLKKYTWATEQPKKDYIMESVYKSIIFVLVSFTLLFIEEIHIVSCMVFFALLLYNPF